MSNQPVYVRMKRYNKPKGDVCRRYVYRGALFKAGEWRQVSRALAEDLLKKIQPNSEDNPRPLFDVAESLDEAEAMDAAAIPATTPRGARAVSDIREKPAVLRDSSRMLEPEPLDDDERAPGDLSDDDVKAVDVEIDKSSKTKKRKPRTRK